MRADARKNHDALLEAAAAVFADQGADASLRVIARRADVGLATLLRNFPTRDALLEVLLRNGFTELATQGQALMTAADPRAALLIWLRQFVESADVYGGVVEVMAAAIENPDSALHAACVEMRASGAHLLARAQQAGVARSDLDGADLFLLAAGFAWTRGQASSPARREHILDVQLASLVT
ncbi:TetR/AcrR family transcriptional regulator [Curtobacterium sp. VKM Ac-1376]|uniref:TetR/AcrR family transcriptional regulator n=1 Tax=Curtobacterium sp. VKM Ac-1376 TaxID=123312 RepID=UPI00188A2A1E|nr:TetR/AcrR family transcriptional regulator [Curtobacterium sp. VKM Ac-1376]MBF4615900.1 TetR/AcrR family transcriptional regulator [Curtobacterium sp. VKM Ac-1376]